MSENPKDYKSYHSSESRICFGLAFFSDKLDAEAFAKTQSKFSINGGFLHGSPCGRTSEFDKTANGMQLYAVRTP